MVEVVKVLRNILRSILNHLGFSGCVFFSARESYAACVEGPSVLDRTRLICVIVQVEIVLVRGGTLASRGAAVL